MPRNIPNFWALAHKFFAPKASHPKPETLLNPQVSEQMEKGTEKRQKTTPTLGIPETLERKLGTVHGKALKSLTLNS